MMSLMFFLFMMILLYCIKNNMLMLSQYFYLINYFYMLILNCNFFFSKISYFLGLDFFSYNLILMTFLIGSFMLMSMKDEYMVGIYFMINLFMVFFLFFIFSTLNLLYMYMSFEFVLIPLVILILGWGYQPERLLAGMYLFFYTLLVSLPLLIFIIMIYFYIGSLFFDYLILNSFFLINHFILVLVFMVKMPMYMVHFWLPKAHVQAPVSGSMILAGLMLKIGGYGLIRVMYIYEYMYIHFSYIWFTVSIIGSIMISLICLVQGDIKCLIAYSSISHMGLVIMGLMTMSSWGLKGSYMLMLAHGFCSSGMFYMANLFYTRTLSRSFFINKGLMLYMPSSSLFWFLFCIFNMSCPPSLNFMSEIMILMSMLSFWFYSVVFFVFISFVCACFSYYLYSYIQHGLFNSLYSFSYINVSEYLILIMHLIPLFTFPVMMLFMF